MIITGMGTPNSQSKIPFPTAYFSTLQTTGKTQTTSPSFRSAAKNLLWWFVPARVKNFQFEFAELSAIWIVDISHHRGVERCAQLRSWELLPRF
jgi:hypothetical protein